MLTIALTANFKKTTEHRQEQSRTSFKLIGTCKKRTPPPQDLRPKSTQFLKKMCIEALFEYVSVRLEFPNKVKEKHDVEIGFPPARELDFQFFEGSKKTLQNTSC